MNVTVNEFTYTHKPFTLTNQTYFSKLSIKRSGKARPNSNGHIYYPLVKEMEEWQIQPSLDKERKSHRWNNLIEQESTHTHTNEIIRRCQNYTDASFKGLNMSQSDCQ